MFYNITFYIVNILLLLILSLGLFLQRKDKNERSRFSLVLLTTGLYSLINIFSELVEGHPELTLLSYIVNVLAFFIVDLIVASFTWYLSGFLGEAKKPSVYFIVVYSLCAVSIIVNFILLLTGHLFLIVDGFYTSSDMIFFPYVFSAIILVALIVLIIVYHKKLTLKQLIVIILYESIPIVFIIVELFTEAYFLTAVGTTLSVTLVYVLIQDTSIEDNKAKQNLLEHTSKTDFLTGMNNRRAYYLKNESIKEKDSVGVVFCDINGLKFTNDHYGHAKGDELIKKFSSMIVKQFGSDNTFRISGDEFVAIVKCGDEEIFNDQIEVFYKTVVFNKHIAAVGSSYGLGVCLDALIKEAETKMYEDKAKFGIKR